MSEVRTAGKHEEMDELRIKVAAKHYATTAALTRCGRGHSITRGITARFVGG